MSSTGYYMPWYLWGGLLTVIGDALLFTVNDSTSTGRLYGYSILSGIGAGSFIQAGFSVAQARVKPADIPLAIGFITCGQVGGATISLAIANALFLNGGVDEIKKVLPEQSEKNIQDALAGASAEFFGSLDADTRHEVIKAIIHSMKYVYVLGITAGALVVLMSVFMKREKLFMKPGSAA